MLEILLVFNLNNNNSDCVFLKSRREDCESKLTLVNKWSTVKGGQLVNSNILVQSIDKNNSFQVIDLMTKRGEKEVK